MSRLVRAACLIPVLVALAGCGGGASPASVKMVDVAPTKIRAIAAAKAINLTLDDLPLFKRDRVSSADKKRNEVYDRAFNRCLGLPAGSAGLLAEVGTSFSTQLRQVSSEVDVVPTFRVADRDVAAMHKPGAADCVGSVLKSVVIDAVGGQGDVASSRVSAFTPNAAYGAKGAFGFEATMKIRIPQGEMPMHFAFMGFAHKHTEVSLLVIGLGQAFPSDQRDGLFITLVQNAHTKAV